MAAELLELAGAHTLAKAARSDGSSGAHRAASTPPIDSSVAAARRELARRSARAAHLPAHLVEGAGWNMLVDLFAMEAQGRPVSVTSACTASMHPNTTALRWIQAMVGEGHLDRFACDKDRRMTFLRLGVRCRVDLDLALKAMDHVDSAAGTK